MFTGIIEETAKIISISPQSGKKLLRIARPLAFDDIKIGSSIACDGICLTVLDFDKTSFSVEIMHETLDKSTAKSWLIGRMLNLERAMILGGRMDGHWLQGHVDRDLRVISHQKIAGTDYLRFELINADRALLVPQGSVAINGVSLTIAELRSDYFSVALIGHTLSETNLSSLKASDRINVEYDIVGKYLVRLQVAGDRLMKHTYSFRGNDVQ
ncbi:MAG: riboflavin synthase [Candidatus Cloacimonas sp.]|jgi:riboflavin synthase|nr:riboflavin synthase [Candidatus Cloacimonas sp.]